MTNQDRALVKMKMKNLLMIVGVITYSAFRKRFNSLLVTIQDTRYFNLDHVGNQQFVSICHCVCHCNSFPFSKAKENNSQRITYLFCWWRVRKKIIWFIAFRQAISYCKTIKKCISKSSKPMEVWHPPDDHIRLLL